jgi:hypothetical protein
MQSDHSHEALTLRVIRIALIAALLLCGLALIAWGLINIRPAVAGETGSETGVFEQRETLVKRLILSIIAASALAVSSLGAVAAAPPSQANCSYHLTAVIGPPGLALVATNLEGDRLVGFGRIVSFVATSGGTNFEECFAALIEANE